jgi:hypothetical protein
MYFVVVYYFLILPSKTWTQAKNKRKRDRRERERVGERKR